MCTTRFTVHRCFVRCCHLSRDMFGAWKGRHEKGIFWAAANDTKVTSFVSGTTSLIVNPLARVFESIDVRFACDLCDRTYKQRTSLRRHRKTTHGGTSGVSSEQRKVRFKKKFLFRFIFPAVAKAAHIPFLEIKRT